MSAQLPTTAAALPPWLGGPRPAAARCGCSQWQTPPPRRSRWRAPAPHSSPGGMTPAWPECAGCSSIEDCISRAGIYTVRIPGWGHTVSATSSRAPCQRFISSAHAREPASIGVPTQRHRTKENTCWGAIASHCTCGLRRAEGHASAAAWPRPKPTAARSACDPRACRHLSCQCNADWIYMQMDVTPT